MIKVGTKCIGFFNLFCIYNSKLEYITKYENSKCHATHEKSMRLSNLENNQERKMCSEFF